MAHFPECQMRKELESDVITVLSSQTWMSEAGAQSPHHAYRVVATQSASLPVSGYVSSNFYHKPFKGGNITNRLSDDY